MTNKLSVDSKTTALLVMDFQTLVVENYATDKDTLLAQTARLLNAARGRGIMVIYVVVGFRPGFPEVSTRNISFSAIKGTGRFAADDPNAEIHRAVAPNAGETVVTKHRVGAFAGTDLDMILRANNIETLLLSRHRYERRRAFNRPPCCGRRLPPCRRPGLLLRPRCGSPSRPA